MAKKRKFSVLVKRKLKSDLEKLKKTKKSNK